jgi:N-acetylglucosaminyldiphosphoundecaprenol N-acetyl-beta-D-mannosaminyltransferase
MAIKKENKAQTETISLFGYEVFSQSREVLLSVIRTRLREQIQTTVYALNPNKVMAGLKDSNVQGILSRSDILIPDGVGISLAAKLQGKHIVQRITGIDFALALMPILAEENTPAFLYGAKPEVVKSARDKLSSDYGPIIAGFCNGYTENMDDLIQMINDTGARVLFVALGSPDQEIFIDRFKSKLPNVTLYCGMGGSLDVISGQVKRAPVLMQRIGLEWLFRFMKNPVARLQKNHIMGYLFYTMREAFALRR